MTETSTEKPESALLIDRIRGGELPREFLLLAARGLLPIALEEMVGALVFLSSHDDEEVATTAGSSLRELPPRIVIDFARSEASGAEALERLAVVVDDPAVLEAIVRNRATSDTTVEVVARNATPLLQEVIVINQERILRSPGILDALLENPALGADVRRRAMETREEFFLKKKLEALPELDGYPPLTEAEESELAEILAEVDPSQESQPLRATPPPEGADPEELDLWNRINLMTVSQKVMCAFRGGKAERVILVRDRNRLVSTAAVRSPKVTETEIEAFAAMRSVEEEVLRIIGSRREWVRKYPIILNLVRNPKAPVGVVLPLINRLTLRDLKSLSSDKNVSDAVRQSARRLYTARKQ
jgi:hypothetical protein